jgi:hypothetical protein
LKNGIFTFYLLKELQAVEDLNKDCRITSGEL